MIILETNIGVICIKVHTKKAPITAKNFINYIEEGFYDGTIFHRVIKNFMIQGGGFNKDMDEKSSKNEIKNEAKNGLKNTKYTVAMARTMMPHSASSQFFINTTDNDFLDYPGQDGWGYCVFAKVVKGQDVVDKINSVSTAHHGMHADVPNEPVIILKATIEKATKKKKVTVKNSIVKKNTKKVTLQKSNTKKAIKKKIATKKAAKK